MHLPYGSLEKAIEIATIAHTRQMDKSGQPYILHPLRVMLSMNNNFERTVAVLHDVIEDDSAFGAIHLSRLFGDDVAEAVVALSRNKGESYEEFILRAKQNPVARRVKIADIKDNLRPGAESLRPRYEAALKVLEE